MNIKIKIALILLIAAVMAAGCKKEEMLRYEKKQKNTEYVNNDLYQIAGNTSAGYLHNEILENYLLSYIEDSTIEIISFIEQYLTLTSDELAGSMRTFDTISNKYDYIQNILQCCASNGIITQSCISTLGSIFAFANSDFTEEELDVFINTISSQTCSNECEYELIGGVCSILKYSSEYWNGENILRYNHGQPEGANTHTAISRESLVALASYMQRALCGIYVSESNRIYSYDMAGFVLKYVEVVTAAVPGNLNGNVAVSQAVGYGAGCSGLAAKNRL